MESMLTVAAELAPPLMASVMALGTSRTGFSSPLPAR